MKEEPSVSFEDLSLSKAVLKVLAEVGYEVPTAIQARTIPPMLAGRDVLGQAQTGTGKTAAFALPLLTRIELERRELQVLVLTPTRELAIQVSEAFQRYAAHLKDFHVLPIYGGQAYDGQLRALKRGVHVVVGTPGRVMDHMRRKTLRLGNLKCLVLDEGDEMLRMGFIDDVEWILEQTPAERQTALFSATMPEPIRRIAQKYLRDPEHIAIKERTMVAATIQQYHWMVSGGGMHKVDALTRILEAEPFDGVLVFVRTRTMTVELAEKLAARGYASAALSGEMVQKRREETVAQLKKGRLDILVATDVAARGLDIDRISHVINFDIPADGEAYIHRIGRTGRAGRTGKAILFVAPRERRLLYAIERVTQQKIARLELPTAEMINDQRIVRFKQTLTDVLASEDLGVFRMVLEQYRQEHNVEALDMASGLAKLVQGDEPLLLAADVDRARREVPRQDEGFQAKKEMERFRVEVGRKHGVTPGDLVGALTNEAELTRADIGHIDIHQKHSTIDLPGGMRTELCDVFRKVQVCGERLGLSFMGGDLKPTGKNKGAVWKGLHNRSKGDQSKGDGPKSKRKKDRHRNRPNHGK
jgi:ATP-dependent RNA helicase DeaD